MADLKPKETPLEKAERKIEAGLAGFVYAVDYFKKNKPHLNNGDYNTGYIDAMETALLIIKKVKKGSCDEDN